MKKSKKQNAKRSIVIEGTDIVMDLSKAVSVNTDKNMIHLDQLADGTWRLIYNRNLIPDFSKVVSFKIVRDE